MLIIKKSSTSKATKESILSVVGKNKEELWKIKF